MAADRETIDLPVSPQWPAPPRADRSQRRAGGL